MDPMMLFDEEDRKKTRRRRARRLILVAVVILAALWWRGYLGGWGPVGRSDAWKNVSGSHECFPFRVKDGAGFVYQGMNYDNPSEPVVTRPDWTISRFGRTYVLYEVNPGDMEPSMFQGEFDESLWIGLVGEGGEIVRKIRLATGVKDISGIRRAFCFGAFVSATKADGGKTKVFLRGPKPWPRLRPTGSAWKDYEKRRERRVDQLWEDWPGNSSGYAADWVSARLEDELEEECRRAVVALKAAAPSEARSEALEAELSSANSLAWEQSEESDGEAGNVHWGNFTDRLEREHVMEVYLRNWLEASDDPDGWEAVRNARGVLYGVPFAATSGVAVVSVTRQWTNRRWDGEPEPEGGETVETSEDEPPWILLLRLSPAGVSRKDGALFADYDLIAPGCQDSGYWVDRGTVVIEPAP